MVNGNNKSTLVTIFRTQFAGHALDLSVLSRPEPRPPEAVVTMPCKATLIVALALAITNVAFAADKDEFKCSSAIFPTQIRLAYWGGRGMAISWNTIQKLTNPTVLFAEGVGGHDDDDDDLHKRASSDVSVTYPSSSTYNNHVVIDGLEPHTVYRYRPQCGNQTYTFTTARSAGKGRHGYKFAMVGDMGTMGPDGLSTKVGTGAANPLQPGDLNTIQSLMAYHGQYDFVWHGNI
jgi:acid phosphatase type 7